MILDCQSCGACCDGGAPVEDDDDLVRLRRWYEVVDGKWRQMKIKGFMFDEQCAALKGEIGDEVRCLVYGCRPGVCRDFPVGSWECLEARREYGLETPEPIEAEA